MSDVAAVAAPFKLLPGQLASAVLEDTAASLRWRQRLFGRILHCLHK